MYAIMKYCYLLQFTGYAERHGQPEGGDRSGDFQLAAADHRSERREIRGPRGDWSTPAPSTRRCPHHSCANSASNRCTDAGLELADGRLIEADVGEARATVSGESVTTQVAFGEDGSPPLLGALTHSRAWPWQWTRSPRRLVPRVMIMHAHCSAA